MKVLISFVINIYTMLIVEWMVDMPVPYRMSSFLTLQRFLSTCFPVDWLSFSNDLLFLSIFAQSPLYVGSLKRKATLLTQQPSLSISELDIFWFDGARVYCTLTDNKEKSSQYALQTITSSFQWNTNGRQGGHYLTTNPKTWHDMIKVIPLYLYHTFIHTHTHSVVGD